MQTVRIRKLIFSLNVHTDVSLNLHKSTTIAEVQKMINNKLGINISQQKLYFGGKELTPVHSISDYKISNDDVILLMINNIDNKTHSEKNEAVLSTEKTRAESLYYKIGDPIDVIYDHLGAWFEAKITDIFVNKMMEDIKEQDLIFQVVMDREEETAPICVKFTDIRPRASQKYDISELKPGMIIFVNYNISKPREIGYWYDFKIVDIKRNKVRGTLLMGPNHDEIEDCSIKFVNELMKIEEPKLLSERSREDGNNIPLRKLPLYCKKCKDVQSEDCRECGCNLCGKKNFVDQMIICDECDNTYHLFCLSPPLAKVPQEPEWYCPDCKVDFNEIVQAGENLRQTDTESLEIFTPIASPKLFGAVAGIEVGTWWTEKSQITAEIHNSLTINFDASNDGVYSLILETRQEVYQDSGYDFYYTVYNRYKAPGPDDIKTPVQHFPKLCRQLASNCNNHKTRDFRFGFGKANGWRTGKPIRIIRSGKLSIISKFAPNTGYRYDGTYKVVEYFPEVYNSKWIIWRFLLRRDDPVEAPWTIIRQTYKTKIICTEVHIESKRSKTSEFHLDENVTKFIDKDVVNKNLWEECRKFTQNGKDEFLKKVEEMFTCVCCQDIAVMPVTTSCKHIFCYVCLKRCFHSDISSCPNCRLELDKKIISKVNHNLNAALNSLFARQ